MYLQLGSIPVCPTREKIKEVFPGSVKPNFSNIMCIIDDCVEIKVEVPSSLISHKVFYSDYKSHTTVKCLVGIVPGGGFSFIFPVFPGSISHK